jgi:predicted DNA-binding transcriptional regulator AlpA
MKIYLNTLEDIAFNNLMPWLDDNSDTDQFEEILRAIDINKVRHHQDFFLHLIEMHNFTDIAITPCTLNEWRDFSGIKRNKKTEEMAKQILTFDRANAKVSFYTVLIAHSVSAIMSSLKQQMTLSTGKPLKKQLVDKYVTRLKRIITADVPCEDHSEHDLLVIKLTKLGALAIFLLLLILFEGYINPYNTLSNYDIMTAIALIGMADKELARIASAFSQAHGDFVKSKLQPSPTNKLKALQQQAAGKTGDKGGTFSAHQTIADHVRPEQQNPANNETVGSREGEVERCIGSKEVMHILGIDKGTLHRWRNRKENKIPHFQYSKRGKILYKMSEINAWMKSNPEIYAESAISRLK